MFGRNALAACLIGMCGSVFAQADDAAQKKAEADAATAKAKYEMLMAQYPKFEGGKLGAVENAEKLSGMAMQLLPRSTSIVGRALAKELVPAAATDECSKGTLLLSGSKLSERISNALSFGSQIDQLDADITKATPKLFPPRKGEVELYDATAIAVLSSLASYVGMLRADYSVSNGHLDIDTEWLTASMVMGHKGLSSERFPNGQAVKDLVDRFTTLQSRAIALEEDNKAKKELVERAEGLRKALFTPGEDGLLPVVTTALLYAKPDEANPYSFKTCMAVITQADASPMLLTKQTAWSKGGRAYLYFPLQVSVLQITDEGVPVRGLCKVAVVSTSIKLSDLTQDDPKTPKWQMAQPALGDCGALPQPEVKPRDLIQTEDGVASDTT